MRRVLFVVNPRSGPTRNADAMVGLIHREWVDAGIDYEAIVTTYQGHGADLACQAADEGTDMVVAVGGDGTINEVASGLVGAETALGVVPGGSGNGFARSLGVPLDLTAAVRLLLAPAVKSLDVGTVNGHHFFGGMGLGLDANVAAGFQNFGRRGSIPYYIVGFKEFFQHQPEHLAVRFGDQELTGCPLVLYVANTSEYGSGAIMSPRSKPDDGTLEVCWLSTVSVLSAACNFRRLFDGTIDRWHAMRIHTAREVVITRPSAGYLHTDGDPRWESATLEVGILPRRLRVAVPQFGQWGVSRRGVSRAKSHCQNPWLRQRRVGELVSR